MLLATERLILREWRDSDVSTYVAMNQDPRVMEFFPSLWSEEESRLAAAGYNQSFVENGFGKFAIELKETHEFIGFVGLAIPQFEAHFTPAIEIGWRLASQHFGKGYATEGAREVLRFAFEELHLKEVVSFTVPENKASRNVMEKIGMTRDEKDDFLHPKIAPDHKFSRHVLYRIKNKKISIKKF
ncbi:MAG: GNAT family N-acetyltransferase [Proteobacteria bacterium]|nr:GNAT family N-acetyltransferase [Pseudomonadota bacterium]